MNPKHIKSPYAYMNAESAAGDAPLLVIKLRHRLKWQLFMDCVMPWYSAAGLHT